MNKIERANNGQQGRQVSRPADQLSLYDTYGSVAYGVILQILPQPHLAQQVLVDVFASPELAAQSSPVSSMAVHIIRVARAKALAVKEKLTATPTLHAANQPVAATVDLPKLIFDLSFCEGCTPEQIAERLQMNRSDVLTAMHTYFKSFRAA